MAVSRMDGVRASAAAAMANSSRADKDIARLAIIFTSALEPNSFQIFAQR
jgi:hypothetical protein